MISTVLLLLVAGSTHAASPQTYFVNANVSPTKTTILWQPAAAGGQAQSLDVPIKVEYHALSVTGGRLAMASLDGALYVADLAKATVTALKAQLDRDMDDSVLWMDDQRDISRSLNWSPDGDVLAFVGLDDANVSTLYLYTVSTQNLAKLPVVGIKGAIDVASWSPDGKWLAIVGALTGAADESEIYPWVVSRDGKTVVQLSNDVQTCRLAWAPDNKHLASNTLCYAEVGGNSDLIILPLEPGSPIVLETPNPDLLVRYGEPIWKDANHLVAVKKAGPAGLDAKPEDIKTKLVQYDLTSGSETDVPNAALKDDAVSPYASTFLWYSTDGKTQSLEGLNVVSGARFSVPSLLDPCRLANATVDPESKYAALFTGCTTAGSQKPAVGLYDVTKQTIGARLVDTDNYSLRILGFTAF